MYAYGYRYNSGIVIGAAGGAPFANTSSILFDGVDDYIDLGTSTGLNFSSDFSLSAWVKTSALGSNQFIIDTSTNSSYGYGYSLYLKPDGTVRFWSYSALSAIESVSTLLINTWYHIAVTHNRSGLENKIYINGVVENTLASGGYSATATTNLRIGTSVVFGGTFNGNIDEVSFFSDLLNATEVLAIGGTIPTDLSLLATPPTSWYRNGDEVTAFPTIPDVIGTNNGTAYNENEATMIVPDVP